MNDVPLIVHIVGLELIVPSYGRCQTTVFLQFLLIPGLSVIRKAQNFIDEGQ